MKNTFKIESIAVTINGNPVEIKGVEFTNEANTQELATSGSNINNLVELIGDIAERFDNGKHIPVEEIKAEPVKVESVKVKKPQPVNTDFCEVRTELPMSEWQGGEPNKKPFNVTKAWRSIPVPKELKPDGTDKYHWEGEKGVLGDTVTVNGQTYGIVYIHIYGMKKRSFIIIRSDNAEFEDDIRPEEFTEFIDAINIPDSIKAYIKKVVEL